MPFARADMVEANSLSGIKAPTATRACRFCKIERKDFGRMDIPADERLNNIRDVEESIQLRLSALAAVRTRDRNRILDEQSLSAFPSVYETAGL